MGSMAATPVGAPANSEIIEDWQQVCSPNAHTHNELSTIEVTPATLVDAAPKHRRFFKQVLVTEGVAEGVGEFGPVQEESSYMIEIRSLYPCSSDELYTKARIQRIEGGLRLTFSSKAAMESFVSNVDVACYAVKDLSAKYKIRLSNLPPVLLSEDLKYTESHFGLSQVTLFKSSDGLFSGVGIFSGDREVIDRLDCEGGFNFASCRINGHK